MNVVVRLGDITVEELINLSKFAKNVFINGDYGSVVFIDASDKIVEYLRRKGVWFDTTV